MPESTDTPFLAEVLAHREVFARSLGVDESEVHVRLYLADGTNITALALKESQAFGGHRWGMIGGRSPDDLPAVAIRESHVIKVEFNLTGPRTPIGFHAEAQG